MPVYEGVYENTLSRSSVFFYQLAKSLKSMCKVTGPLLSLDASGSVASTITFSRWKGINYVRQRVIPTYSNTFKQQKIRALITDASQAWKSNGTDGTTTIDATYKSAFDLAAAGKGMSGFDLFIRNCVSKNYNSTVSPYYDGTLTLPTDPTDF